MVVPGVRTAVTYTLWNSCRRPMPFSKIATGLILAPSKRPKTSLFSFIISLLFSFLSLSTLHTLSLHSSVLPTLFFYSCFNVYQQRLDAATYDRKNRAVHGVHDPTIHSQACRWATSLRFTEEDRGSSASTSAVW